LKTLFGSLKKIARLAKHIFLFVRNFQPTCCDSNQNSL